MKRLTINNKQKVKADLPRTPFFKSSAGFTIVELLVAIAIFTVVTSFAVTVFVRSLRAQRSVVALIAANDNASLAIEAISREIRRGRDFSADAGFGTWLRFYNADQNEVIYRFEKEVDANGMVTGGQIMRSENGGGYHSVTAKNVVIEAAHFAVRNDIGGRPILPRITMSFRVAARDRDLVGATTNIHTTVSSRGLNNPTPPNP